MNCQQCNNEVTENYCPKCGFPVKLKRINSSFVFSELVEMGSFDRGIFYTIKELTIHPAKAIKKYIDVDRRKLLKPITFMFLSSLLYTAVTKYLPFANEFTVESEQMEEITKAITWIEQNYGYANLFLALISAIWTKILFFSSKYNYFEHLVLYSYIIAYTTLIATILGIVSSVFSIDLGGLTQVTRFAYITFAIGHFFSPKSFWAYFKGFLSYVLMFLSVIVLIIAGAVAYAVLFKTDLYMQNL